MVISVAYGKLFVVHGNILPYGFGLSEVKRGPIHRSRLSQRNTGWIYRKLLLGIQLQNMIMNSAAPFSGKIEVRMICQVNNGGFIRSGF